jgi:predicted Zn-dependent protease
VGSDFEIEPGLTFGAWLHARIEETAFFERQGFMPDRVRRVAERLQRERAQSERYVVEVPWLRVFTAFTAPGRYIYFSRRMLERCPDDETAALVIAHEIAHHDLGHVDPFGGPFARHASRLDAGQLAILFFRVLQKRLHSPEMEMAADRRALELCVAAGYNGRKCLRLFDVMERWALDYGDEGAVYGPDVQSDDELSPEAALLTRARIWLYQRQRGYLPIRDRHAVLRRLLEEMAPLRSVAPPMP